jgi:transketolase
MNRFSSTDQFAKEIRLLSLKMVYNAKASHIGGALSMTDLLAVLYGRILNFNPNDPHWKDRDRFLLSKGHACVSLYATLALSGYYSTDELDSYGKDGSRFISHTSHKVPGVELSTGSLGHALPVACGIALAAKRKGRNYRTVVLISDGELDEGSNWESILFAPHHNLNNLVLIVDYNKIQSLGRVNEVLSLEPLETKFESFNWDCDVINGHDHEQIFTALSKPPHENKPRVIIAHTIKGKGVDFMENTLLWHYKSPNDSEYSNAIHQINSIDK